MYALTDNLGLESALRHSIPGDQSMEMGVEVTNFTWGWM